MYLLLAASPLKWPSFQLIVVQSTYLQPSLNKYKCIFSLALLALKKSSDHVNDSQLTIGGFFINICSAHFFSSTRNQSGICHQIKSNAARVHFMYNK